MTDDVASPDQHDQAEEIAQLRRALASRGRVGQAQGFLMATLNLNADQAFAYLCRVSSVRNVKVTEVAAEIVETRTIPRL